MKPCAILLALFLASPLFAAEPNAERGRVALTTRTFTPAVWTVKAYDEAWKQWQPPLKEAPRDYVQAFADRYGLHPAPFPNNGLPMGLQATDSLILGKAVAYDCMLCHAGSVLGKSYIGLGNCALDIQALFEEMGRSSGTVSKTPFPFTNVRGTTEAAAAAVYLFQFRQPDLSLRFQPVKLDFGHQMVEDTPAWWLLKKKKTMYATGTAHARSVRSLMQFMLSPANSASAITREEETFKDIQAFLLSLEAPKYPFPINQALAQTGKAIFNKTCSQCHGTYGPDGSYPNKIVELDVIGTDPARFLGLTPQVDDYVNQTWFAQEKGVGDYKTTRAKGYQAPPLDGVWATAPYLHNGSVPTLYDMLNSKTRPKLFTRSFKTGEADYDKTKVGWKVQSLDKGPAAGLPDIERRKVYDTTQPGRGNQGHTFGDELTEEQRRAVVEYLKTL